MTQCLAIKLRFPMGKNVKTISRLELYTRVWETPVTQLAKECGLSDVGFAKI